MHSAANHRPPQAWRWLLWGSIPILLSIPAVAMLLSEEVNWGAEDFIAAAVLFGTTALIVDTVLRHVTTPLARPVLVGSVLLALMLVWAELAVGVLGTPLAGD